MSAAAKPADLKSDEKSSSHVVAGDAITALMAESTPKKLATTKVRKRSRQEKEAGGEHDDGDDDNEEDENETADRVRGDKKSKARRGGLSGTRAPRSSAVKVIFEAEKKLLQTEIDYLKKQLEARDRDILKLEKQLAEERAETKRLYQQVDGYKTSLTSDLTYHMAKSHHSAMQTLHASQQTNAQIASALGQSILRLKDKGNRLKELMPPLPDLKLPNARQIYHEQVANFLNRTVTRLDEGEALLKKIDSAIAESQQSIDEERKRISPSLSQQELADLQHTINEEQTRITALKYERDMLATGLANKQNTSKPTTTPSPPTTTPPTTTPQPTTTPLTIATASIPPTKPIVSTSLPNKK